MIAFADWTAPVGAIGSAIAAIAALVAIKYAKQAAEAGREAVRGEQKLRVEEDFREFGRALWALHEAADNDRRGSATHLSRDVLQAQTRLRSVLVTPVRIRMSDEAQKRLETAMDGHSNPVTVYSAAAALIDDLGDAWDAHEREDRE